MRASNVFGNSKEKGTTHLLSTTLSSGPPRILLAAVRGPVLRSFAPVEKVVHDFVLRLFKQLIGVFHAGG